MSFRGVMARACRRMHDVGMLLQLLLVTTIASCVAGGTSHSSCELLLNNSRAGGEGARELLVHGVACELHVWWSAAEEGAAHAHAALLAAALHRLRYGRVRVRAGTPPPRTPSAATRRSLNVVVREDAAAVQAAGAALLLVRLAASVRRCQSAIAWPFYDDADNLERCGFLRIADLPSPLERALGAGACGRCAALLTAQRHESRARALAACAREQELLVEVVVWDPLRLPPAAINYSVLFFEEPLWSDAGDVLAVQPPPCERPRAPRLHTPLRISGDENMIVLYAPPVYNAVSSFKPSAAYIREVLARSGSGNDVEEAACDWCLQNAKKLDFLDSNMTVHYKIRLFLCIDDPDRDEYDRMASDLLPTIAQDGLLIEVTSASVECARKDVLYGELSKYQDKADEHRTVGWVAPVAGTEQDQFEKYSLPLVAYGAPAAGLRARRAVRTTAGSAHALAAALAWLLRQAGARRLAVLAESTRCADELADALRRHHHLIIRQRNVSAADGGVDAPLLAFRSSGVRVFFVNAEAAVCAEVVCAAERAGMAAEGEYLWIVREWRGGGGCATRPLAVGLAWRGAAGAENWTRPWGPAARALDARWQGRAWPPLAAPLADALLLLAKTLTYFLHRQPESAYDRFVYGTAGNFASAVNQTTLNGITQEISYNSDTYELSSVLVFVERWEQHAAPGARTLLAVWRVLGDRVHDVLYEPGPLHSYAFLSDPSCYTTASGDPFAPKCHDIVWLTSLIVLILATIALLLARRARLHRLKLRDLALLEQLLEQRKTNSSRFASCLVSRSEFELREELGSGAYGRVRAAVLRRAGLPALAVAAKEPKEERLQDEAELIREASVLFSLKHENIVSFVGVCLDGRAVFFMEYAFFGDLRNYLVARRPLAEFARAQAGGAGAGAGAGECAETAMVSAHALTSLARDAAAALHYLALQRIVHRDVRATNCLIDETRRLKLADFGLARHLTDEEEEYTWQNLRRLPAACMAPESLLHGVFSTASDIWALGVLLLELVMLGEPPYGTLGTAAITERVRAGRHPPAPPDIAPRTLEILEWCWSHDPHERPSAARVKDALQRCPAVLAPALARAPPDAS